MIRNDALEAKHLLQPWQKWQKQRNSLQYAGTYWTRNNQLTTLLQP